jgi:hypothetical protein
LVPSSSRSPVYQAPGYRKKKWAVPGAGVDGHSGLAMNRHNKLIFWNGARFIHFFDPDTREWRLFDWIDEGPTIGSKVYSKWVWIPRYDLYVGYADYKSNVWVCRHPKERKGKIVNTTSDSWLRSDYGPNINVRSVQIFTGTIIFDVSAWSDA